MDGRTDGRIEFRQPKEKILEILQMMKTSLELFKPQTAEVIRKCGVSGVKSL